MTIRPTELKLVEDTKLLIGWSDGQKRLIRFRELRDRCPCATCREKRTAQASQPSLLPIVTEAEMQPLRILGMKPVGNYAYAIHFSDGHDSGIFTYELLRELGEEV